MNESSLSNQQVNYRLEEILNKTEGRNGLRSQVLNRFPFCIIYGECPKIICDTLNKELDMQLGSELANEMLIIPQLQEAENVIDVAFQNYRWNIENGNILLKNNYLFPVFFMADQFKAEEMQQFLQVLREKSRQKGIEGNYSIIFYCIFDYERMNGIAIKKEIELFFMEETSRYPLGIITQNNMYQTEFHKYWKGIQAVAMHVFLQCISEENKCLQMQQGALSLYFTLGYWKLDVSKQVLNDQLINALEKQNQRGDSHNSYREGVIEAIDYVANFDCNWWIEQFMKMPILYTSEVEEVFKTKWLGIKKTRIGTTELLEMLYGRKDVFSQFLLTNIGDSTGQESIEVFLEQQIGNFYFVKNEIKDVLNDIERQYERELADCQQNYLMNESVVIDKQNTIADVIQMFGEKVWKQEAKVFLYTRKLNLIHSVQQYLQSSQFKEELEEVEKRNREQCNQLKVLRREMAWNEKGISSVETTEMSAAELVGQISWKDNLLVEDRLESVQVNNRDLQRKMQQWIEKNIDSILSDFIGKAACLKRDNKLELFYAARLNLSYASKENEYLYLNSKYHSSLDLSYKLPDLSIQGRAWQDENSMELFCIKEINDLSQIYNMK